MANPSKQSLSKTVAQMKFMRRRSANRDEIETEGNSLTEKWIVPNIPLPMSGCNWPETTESYVEFEDLDRLGRFSYLKHNKETERLMEKYARQRGGMEEEEEYEEESISAEEMARRYEQLVDNPERRLLGKRKRTVH